MYIVPAIRHSGSRTYRYYKLVESVRTDKGPRQRTIMSLGTLKGFGKDSIKLLGQLIDSRLTGQIRLLPPGSEEPAVGQEAERIAATVLRKRAVSSGQGSRISVSVGGIEAGPAVLLGPVYVGFQLWTALGMDKALGDCGFSARQRTLAMLEVVGRLVRPASELATSGWITHTAAPDLLDDALDYVNKDALYRVSDRLWACRVKIEEQLGGAERRLFALEDTMVLYDLSSTYFEGLARGNPKAQRGYSRDHRGDCKQLVVGMVLDEAGFPKASETWRGDTNDSQTLEEMLGALESRCGKKEGATVVMDRGIATADNVALLRRLGYHYVVALASQSRGKWIGQIREGDFQRLDERHQHIEVCQRRKDDEVYLIVRSASRVAKDQAIRERFVERLGKGLEDLASRVASAKLTPSRALQKIGALRQRYSRASRFFLTELIEEQGRSQLRWSIDEGKLADAQILDGVYILKTDRSDLEPDRLWNLYMMLAGVESSFRYLKTSLGIRPIFHQLQHRSDGHVFISILAYHLLHAIEQKLLAHGDHRSWPTINGELQTHRVLTLTLPEQGGRTHHLRLATNPTAAQTKIYQNLGLNGRPLPTKYTLDDDERSAEN